MISFETTREEHEQIMKIVERAIALAPKRDRTGEFRRDLLMDLTACHANGCRLKLKELAEAEALDLAHDVYGIQQHLNRRTGQLLGFFLPRYANLTEGGAN